MILKAFFQLCLTRASTKRFMMNKYALNFLYKFRQQFNDSLKLLIRVNHWTKSSRKFSVLIQ